jgi:hypothetical protein
MYSNKYEILAEATLFQTIVLPCVWMSPSNWIHQKRIEDRSNELDIWVIGEWIRDTLKEPTYIYNNECANIGHLSR